MKFSQFKQKVKKILDVDFTASYDFSKKVVSSGKNFFNNALEGLKEAGVDENDVDMILVSTHNGMALEYAKLLKKEIRKRCLTIPVVMGGVLNQKVEDRALPVDVSQDLKALGFKVATRLDDGQLHKMLT